MVAMMCVFVLCNKCLQHNKAAVLNEKVGQALPESLKISGNVQLNRYIKKAIKRRKRENRKIARSADALADSMDMAMIDDSHDDIDFKQLEMSCISTPIVAYCCGYCGVLLSVRCLFFCIVTEAFSLRSLMKVFLLARNAFCAVCSIVSLQLAIYQSHWLIELAIAVDY
uniref:40S ribosomal protein S19-binding protein 1 n=1 Tax=Ascaris lumbricoides TaxID=6252 RepID=A0A0M3IUV5_ASCLU